MNINLQSLNTEARKWLLHATAGMAAADGDVSEAEMNRLREALALLGDEVDVASILDELKNSKLTELEPIELEKKEAFEVLKDLMHLAAVDGELSGGEAKFIDHVTELLGFPPDVAEKMKKVATKLASDTLRAQFTYKEKKVAATCLRLSKGGMVAITDTAISPNTSVMVSFYDRSIETGKISNLFLPFSSHIQTCQKHPQEEGSFVLQVEFLEKLTINNGVRPLLFPKHYEQGTAKPIPEIHPLLEGYYNECRICGNREVVVWDLKESTPSPEQNMFHIDIFPNENVASNPSLFKVAICPNCLFASPFREYFYKAGNQVHPLPMLNCRRFQTKWMTTTINRKRDLEYDFEWLGAMNRSESQGMLAWELAVNSHEHLVEYSEHATLDQEWHMIQCMLERTTLLSQQGKHRTGNGYLQRVIVRIETFLENLKQHERFEPLHLLTILVLHEENLDKFKKYSEELEKIAEELADKEKFKKQIETALIEIKAAEDNQKLYFKSKRQDYNKPKFEAKKEESKKEAKVDETL